MSTEQPLLTSGPADISWRAVRAAPDGPLAKFLLGEGVIDQAVRSRTFGTLESAIAQVLPSAGEVPDFLVHEFANTYLLWYSRDPFVRRAWLCIGILRHSTQRAGGYTGNDIGHMARVRTRAARRRIVAELLRLGVLRAVRRRGRQPRYRSTGGVKLRHLSGMEDDHAWATMDDLLRAARRVVPLRKTIRRRDEVPLGKPWFDVRMGYVIGGPAPPGWVLEGFSALAGLYSAFLGTAFSLPPGRPSRVAWTPDRLREEIFRNMPRGVFVALADASKRANRGSWHRWMRRMYDAGTEPVFLAALPDLIAEARILAQPRANPKLTKSERKTPIRR